MGNTKTVKSRRTKSRQSGLDIATLAQPGYWISPDNEIMKVDKHIHAVWDNPAQFGYAPDELKRIYDSFNEKYRLEGKAREEIIVSLVSRGWIRIRRYSDYWSVNVPTIDTRVCRQLTDFARQLLGQGVAGVRESDPDLAVKITVLPECDVNRVLNISDIVQGKLTSRNNRAPYPEVRKKYPVIEMILHKMSDAIPGELTSLGRARDFFISELDKNKINNYVLLSYVVEQYVKNVVDAHGIPTIRTMDADMFQGFLVQRRNI